MADRFKNLEDEILTEYDSSILLRELEDGPSRLNLLDGLRRERFGPEVARVSPFPRRVKVKASKTKGTSGPISFGSSPSACLQQSLESRLRARLDVNGSLEYDLVWKHWDTDSDAPICALRASARRISVSVCTGWPIEGWPKTPMASDGDGGVMEIRPGTLGKYKLRDFAQLAGWATATASKTTQSGELQNSNGGPWDGTSKPYQNGKQVTTALGDQVKLAGWMTTRVSMGDYQNDKGDVTKPRLTLHGQVKLVGWATVARTDDQQGRMSREAALRNKSSYKSLSRDVLTVPGILLESYLVPTGRRVALAPEFSLWLMGFPTAWARTAPNSDAWRAAQAALELECSKEVETQSPPI